MSTSFKSEEFMENILKPMTVFLISQTEEDSVDPKSILFKICTMVSKL
jgi:hypothetical protein